MSNVTHSPCPGCDGTKQRRSRLCRACANRERRAAASYRPLHASDPGYGPTCPDCGGCKYPAAFRCGECEAERRPGVHMVSRRESIITFRDLRTDSVRSLQCFGDDKAAQIRDGITRLPEGTWLVESRSTPETILSDLRRSAA